MREHVFNAAATSVSVASAPVMVNIAGYEAELISVILGLATTVAVRLLFGFSDQSKGALRREILKTLLAVIFVLTYTINYQPGPGVAVIAGAGVGITIATLLDIIAEWAVKYAKRLGGVDGGEPKA